MQALASNPRNPIALKNPDAIFGKEGDSLKPPTISTGPSRSIPRSLRPFTGSPLLTTELKGDK